MRKRVDLIYKETSQQAKTFKEQDACAQLKNQGLKIIRIRSNKNGLKLNTEKSLALGFG